MTINVEKKSGENMRERNDPLFFLHPDASVQTTAVYRR